MVRTQAACAALVCLLMLAPAASAASLLDLPTVRVGPVTVGDDGARIDTRILHVSADASAPAPAAPPAVPALEPQEPAEPATAADAPAPTAAAARDDNVVERLAAHWPWLVLALLGLTILSIMLSAGKRGAWQPAPKPATKPAPPSDAA